MKRRSFLAASATVLAAPHIAKAQSKTIKIGTILSVTGPLAFLGDKMKRGMQLAIEQINAQGGVDGRKIEWTLYDAENQTTKAVNATRRLIEQDEVDAIVGGGCASGIAIAMSAITERSQVPFMATEGSMLIVNPIQDHHWSFKATVDDDQMLSVAADFWHTRKISSVALLFDSSGFGQSAREQMEKVAPKNSLDVAYETFNPGDTDLTAQLTRLKSKGVQSILCWTNTTSGVVYLKQAQSMGFSDKPLMNGYGFVDQRYMELAGPAAENTYLLSLKFPVGQDLPDSDPVKAKIVQLTKDYTERFQEQPNMFVAETYDALNIVATAIRTHGGTRAQIRDGIAQTTGFSGSEGNFTFSADRHSGLAKSDGVVITWRDKRFRLASAV